MQRREVSCQLSNSTEVDLELCSEVEKPPQRQECYNDNCKGTWKVGEWSDVSNTTISQYLSNTNHNTVHVSIYLYYLRYKLFKLNNLCLYELLQTDC